MGGSWGGWGPPGASQGGAKGLGGRLSRKGTPPAPVRRRCAARSHLTRAPLLSLVLSLLAREGAQRLSLLRERARRRAKVRGAPRRGARPPRPAEGEAASGARPGQPDRRPPRGQGTRSRGANATAAPMPPESLPGRRSAATRPRRRGRAPPPRRRQRPDPASGPAAKDRGPAGQSGDRSPGAAPSGPRFRPAQRAAGRCPRPRFRSRSDGGLGSPPHTAYPAQPRHAALPRLATAYCPSGGPVHSALALRIALVAAQCIAPWHCVLP